MKLNISRKIRFSTGIFENLKIISILEKQKVLSFLRLSIEKRKFFLRLLALKFIGINFLLSLVAVVVFIEEVGLVDEKVLVKEI